SWPPWATESRVRAVRALHGWSAYGNHRRTRRNRREIILCALGVPGGSRDLVQEARAVDERADAEDAGERLAEVCERATRPKIHARAHAHAGHQQGHV